VISILLILLGVVLGLALLVAIGLALAWRRRTQIDVVYFDVERDAEDIVRGRPSFRPEVPSVPLGCVALARIQHRPGQRITPYHIEQTYVVKP
jgi:hypothetical protein